MTRIEWLDDTAPDFEELCTLYGWNPATYDADAHAFNHAAHLIETTQKLHLEFWPDHLRNWLICTTRSGTARALAIHEVEPFKSELIRVSDLWAHIAALSVGMVQRITDEVRPTTQNEPDQTNPTQPPDAG